MLSLTTRTRAERCFGRSESSSEKPGRRSGRAHIGKRGAAAGVKGNGHALTAYRRALLKL